MLERCDVNSICHIWQKITTFEKLSKVLIIVLWSPTRCSSPHISEWILVITLTGSCRCSWCQRQTGAPLGCWWYCCHRASHHRETLLEALLSNYESPLQHPLSRHWTPSHCRTRPHLITPLQAERRHLTSIFFFNLQTISTISRNEHASTLWLQLNKQLMIPLQARVWLQSGLHLI